MSDVAVVIVWWAGVIVIMLLLAAATFLAGSLLKYVNQSSWRFLCDIVPITTARYWVLRMEREGLTVCRKEYRRMVAERKPKTAADYEQVEREMENRDE